MTFRICGFGISNPFTFLGLIFKMFLHFIFRIADRSIRALQALSKLIFFNNGST